MDKDKNPIPWMNYSIMEFLNDRMNKNINIFEYGSGYSTLYFANLVKNIISIEYNEEWFNAINKKLNSITNINLVHIPFGINYVTAIENINSDNKIFELIIIDGRNRVECARISLNYLTQDGILLLDDSDRERYQEIFSIFKDNGFKEMTISGLKPNGLGIFYTTLFYRSKNVFNI